MKASAGNRIVMLQENSLYPQDARVRREARTLVDAGYKVTVIAPGRRQRWSEKIDGVSVYRFPQTRDGQGMLGYLWEYGYSTLASFLWSLWVFCRHGFDVLHAHNPPETFSFLAAFYKLFGKRFVFDHHDLSPEMYLARFEGPGNPHVFRVLVWLEKLSCRLADHVIATNESYKEIEMSRGCVPSSKITVVRNGPDLNRVRLMPRDEELCQRASTIIGYVGVMGYQDGVEYLLRACRRLIDDCGRSDFFCVLIGRGDALEDLRRQATELGLEQHVWFTGFVNDEDMLRYLSSANICVAPEPRNAFTERSTMIKIMEYMALRKPIVAFDLTEHRVTAGDAALYATPNDELEFATQIARLMDDREQRERMGRVGRERIDNHLEWRFQARHLIQAYASLDLQPTSVPQRRPEPLNGERVQPRVEQQKLLARK